MISLYVLPGIIGAVFCAFNKNFTANLIWSFSNLLMIYHVYGYGDIDSVKLFAVYEVIAVLGVARSVKERFKNPSFSSAVNMS